MGSGAKELRVGRPGQRLTGPDGLEMILLQTAAASGGHALEMEWLVPAGRRLVAADHYHPDGPEVWTVVEGSAGYRLGGRELDVEAPHELVVPGGTSHGHPWNAGATPLRVRQLISSPDEPIPEIVGGVQGYFETYFAFAQAGEVDEDGRIGGRLQDALTIHDLLLGGTYLAGLPRALQRIGLGAAAALARARGLEPYREPAFQPG